jgi:hypothetical protein
VVAAQGATREVAGTDVARAELTVEQILAWADAHRAAHGIWPEAGLRSGGGPVDGAPGETWNGINYALAIGLRGLSGDSSLAELLAEHRGVPAPDMGPKALAEKIWAWEQEHFPTGRPRIRVGTQPKPSRPPLSTAQILAWADAHHAATGRWPNRDTGPVDGVPGETWAGINRALLRGGRGLVGGTSLARLLRQYRGAKAHTRATKLTVEQILAWADAHRSAHGRWPRIKEGAVDGVAGENWNAISLSLVKGHRGLPGGLSLARLLTQYRGYRYRAAAPRLTHEQILAWADAYHAAHSRWPTAKSGPIAAAPGETWNGIAQAFQAGRRGLSRSLMLPALLEQHRGHRNNRTVPRLTHEQILAWADAHHAAHGHWPTARSGPISGAPGETWHRIAKALLEGLRGLSRGTTLPRLLAQHRGHRNRSALPKLTLDQILGWAEAYHAAHGRWPGARSGPIPGSSGETWRAIASALVKGNRGLAGGTTLARLLASRRRPVR